MANLLPFNQIPKSLESGFFKKICLINHIRSKFFTILLILFALLYCFYDVFILKKTLVNEEFVLHLKADIVFLVLSFFFTLFIYFNQVKSSQKLKTHHRYIHFVITIFVLLWSAFKSVIFVKFNEGNYNLAIICILITSIIYLFPFIMYSIQLLINLLFIITTNLVFQITITEIAKSIYMVILISVLAMIISRIMFYQQHKILTKEKEVLQFRKNHKTSSK